MFTSKQNGAELASTREEPSKQRKKMELLKLAVVILLCDLIECRSSLLQELSLNEVEHLVLHRQWDNPFCVIFLQKNRDKAGIHSNQTEVERYLKMENSLIAAKKKKCFKRWSFPKMYIDENHVSTRITIPPSVYALRCYIGTATHSDYNWETSARKWLKKIRYTYENRIHVLQNGDIEKVIQEHVSADVFIVVIPGRDFFEVIEQSLHEVRENCQAFCHVCVAPPETHQERFLEEKFGITTFPTALIFHRNRRGTTPTLKERVEGVHLFCKEHILLRIITMRSKTTSLSMDNFASNALTLRQGLKPLLVCFYSSSNPISYKYVHAFERAASMYSENKEVSVPLRFGLVDLAVIENIKILSRHLDVVNVQRIPFVVVFWQIHSEPGAHLKLEIKQAFLPDLTPTPWNIRTMLHDLGILPNKDLSIIRNSHFHMFCSANLTMTDCSPGDRPLQYFGPVLNPNFTKMKKRKSKPILKRLHGIPLLTDQLWSRYIERTSQNKAPRLDMAIKYGTQAQPSVKLVIFIMADCGYCEIMMPHFSNLSRIARNIHGVSVYLMNCTASPVQCKKNGVTGYPTLALFRSISEEESRSCVLENTTSSSVRLDYHGNMQIDDILSWLSKAAMSAVSLDFQNSTSSQMKKDVRLTAFLYTKSLAREYLSRSLQQKLIPLQCFKLACEILFGMVECVAKPSEDVITKNVWKGNVKEKDLVLDQVLFERADGAKTTIFKLTYPMENTIESSHDVELHKFHRKHRYKIPSGFRCEDSHPLCIDILVKFVEDHQRLPITHITRESFHSHGSTSSIFSKEFSVLIALVHKTNVSSDSPFLEELNKAARSLYTKMIVATLNVDEFPSWASQFVPRDYHYKHHDTLHKVPAMYHYPRLCIIDWDDHQHAAFYPPPEELETSEDVAKRLSKVFSEHIIEFSEEYLRDKERLTVETEMF